MAPKSGQPAGSALYRRLLEFDPDLCHAPIVGQSIEVVGSEAVPMHQHARGQLLITSRGIVTCETVDGLWPIPPGRALWIPGKWPHRTVVSSGGTVSIIYFAADAAKLPSAACFLSLSPLLHEMVLHMARAAVDYGERSFEGRLAGLLLDHLGEMEIEMIYLPVPNHPRLRRIAEMMFDEPGSRRTLAEWASLAAMSERSLRRQIEHQTGMTFGRWRQQFQLAVAMRDLRLGVPIQRVAEALGYESVSAFATMFKKNLGTPPGRYAKGRAELGLQQLGQPF